jgi:hypothetical protein
LYELASCPTDPNGLKSGFKGQGIFYRHQFIAGIAASLVIALNPAAAAEARSSSAISEKVQCSPFVLYRPPLL